MDGKNHNHQKRCPKCDSIKDVGHFGLNKATKDGLSVHCLSCKAQAQRELNAKEPDIKRLRDKIWREKNGPYKRKRDLQRYRDTAHIVRARNLMYFYGITIERYNKMLADQGGGCAICGSQQNLEEIVEVSLLTIATQQVRYEGSYVTDVT